MIALKFTKTLKKYGVGTLLNLIFFGLFFCSSLSIAANICQIKLRNALSEQQSWDFYDFVFLHQLNSDAEAINSYLSSFRSFRIGDDYAITLGLQNTEDRFLFIENIPEGMVDPLLARSTLLQQGFDHQIISPASWHHILPEDFDPFSGTSFEKVVAISEAKKMKQKIVYHFFLDGLDLDVVARLIRIKSPLKKQVGEGFTEHELRFILSQENLLSKTSFYLHGKRLDREDLREYLRKGNLEIPHLLKYPANYEIGKDPVDLRQLMPGL